MNLIRKISELWIMAAVALLPVAAVSAAPAEKTFILNGTSFVLQDASPDVQVQFQSMRLNRALNVWNVEANLVNKGTQAVNGPFVVSVESFSGTTGLLQADGSDGGIPAKGFLDMTGTIPAGTLGPGVKSLSRTLRLGVATGSPKLVTKVFAARQTAGVALALARTLNDAGQPLGDVTIEEIGPSGTNVVNSDSSFGIATLGHGSGTHAWKFSKGGYLPVWRQQSLGAEAVTVLANPRLTRRSTNVFTATPIGGTTASADGAIQITYSPGALAQNVTITVTAVSGQNLPGPLPLGWSPLQAFWLEHSSEPVSAVNLVMRPAGAINSTERAALVRFNESTLRWEVTQLLAGNGTNPVSGSIALSGAYALVVADSGPGAPPVAGVGQPLNAATAGLPDLGNLTASGSVTPATSAASRVPELVTAQADVIVKNTSGELPSGLLLRTEISDAYQLQDGTSRHPPQFEADIFAYQRPGDNQLGTLHAMFPLRPLLLFGSEELQEGKVTANVLTPSPFAGGILDSGGGILAIDGVQIVAGAGDIAGQQAAQLRRLNATNFADLAGTNIILAAFELSISGVSQDRHLRVELAAPTNGNFVLARVVYDQGLYGLEPVERLASDSSGGLRSGEPAIGESLQGITGPGQYVLVQVKGEQGIIIGTAKKLGWASRRWSACASRWATVAHFHQARFISAHRASRTRESDCD